MLTFTDNEWRINAGIDESNAKDKIILLPKNPFETAELIQKKLIKKFNLKRLGILITDTKSLPLRIGTIGKAIGYAGFKPLKNYIGKKDLFGRKSRYTQSNIADALAASAVLIMGEGNEQIPIVIIRNSPIQFISKKFPINIKIYQYRLKKTYMPTFIIDLLRNKKCWSKKTTPAKY